MQLKIFIVSVLLFGLFQSGHAAEVKCTADDAQIRQGIFDVKCSGETYLGIDGAHQQANLKTKEKLEAAEKLIAAKDGVIGQHEKLMQQYNLVIQNQKDYIAELESAYKGYKDLASDYKKMREPWFILEGGFGSSGDSDPSALVGVGLWRLRVWKYFQKGNGGWLAGISLPLF